MFYSALDEQTVSQTHEVEKEQNRHETGGFKTGGEARLPQTRIILSNSKDKTERV